MAKKIFRLFSNSELARIAEAVKNAEGKTSGEIVPFVVERSDAYESALWRGGFALSASVGLGIVLGYELSTTWFPLLLIEILTALFLAQALGMLLVLFVPAGRRFFAGEDARARAVKREAQAAFLAEEIFKTRDRTGILIFMSLLERRVEVLGDAGINAKVKQTEWEDVVQTIVAGMRAQQPAEGLIAAIQKCGELLQRQGVIRRADDADELSNALRMKEGA